MQKLSRILVLALLPCVLSACQPGVRVRKNPGDKDCGIRYYRPKPYLKITPFDQVTTLSDESSVTGLSDEMVKLELEYLPDFTEEYSLEVTPGLGTADVQITLDKGWNLTQLNQDLDSKFDENLTAVTGLLSALAPSGVVAAPGGRQTSLDESKDGPVPSAYKSVVRASNVPIGYYESVITECNGVKHLCGWRYVGFAPFGCPDCTWTNSTPLYGLVFQNGVMVFRQLDQIGDGDTTRDPVPTGFTAPSTSDETDETESVEGFASLALLQGGIDADVAIRDTDELLIIDVSAHNPTTYGGVSTAFGASQAFVDALNELRGDKRIKVNLYHLPVTDPVAATEGLASLALMYGGVDADVSIDDLDDDPGLLTIRVTPLGDEPAEYATVVEALSEDESLKQAVNDLRGERKVKVVLVTTMPETATE